MNAADVLAVMDGFARTIRTGYIGTNATQLEEARDAVAELIEAASAGRHFSNNAAASNPEIYFSVRKAARLSAALARCKGETK